MGIIQFAEGVLGSPLLESQKQLLLAAASGKTIVLNTGRNYGKSMMYKAYAEYKEQLMKDPSEPIHTPCENCGRPVPSFTYKYCCRGAIDLCDCGGDPINTCLCNTCQTMIDDQLDQED